MFIVTSERKSEQTWEREDFQLLGEFFLLFFFSLSSLVWTHWWEVFWFVCVCGWACVCFGDGSVGPRTLALGLFQATPCTTLFCIAHRSTFIQSTMPFDWGERAGGGSRGTKGLGREKQNWVKITAFNHLKKVFCFWNFNMSSVDPVFLPAPMCEIWAAVSPVCWLLSMSRVSVNAGCDHVSCVVHIKPVCLLCKHTVCVCRVYRRWCVCLFLVLCRNQTFAMIYSLKGFYFLIHIYIFCDY